MTAITTSLDAGRDLHPRAMQEILVSVGAQLTTLTHKLNSTCQEGGVNGMDSPHLSQLRAVEKVFGPLFETIAESGGKFVATMTGEHLGFIVTLLRDATFALEKLVQMNQQSLKTAQKAEEVLNTLYQPDGEDDDSYSVGEMLRHGMEDELCETASRNMRKRGVLHEFFSESICRVLMDACGPSTLQYAVVGDLNNLLLKNGRLNAKSTAAPAPVRESPKVLIGQFGKSQAICSKPKTLI